MAWTDLGEVSAAVGVTAVGEHAGDVYSGLQNTGSVYKYISGTTWSLVGTPGSDDISQIVSFNGDLIVMSDLVQEGVWRYLGGTSWEQIMDYFDVYPYNICVFGSLLCISCNYSILTMNTSDEWGDFIALFPPEMYGWRRMDCSSSYVYITNTNGSIYRCNGVGSATNIGTVGGGLSGAGVILRCTSGDKVYVLADDGNVYRWNGISSWLSIGKPPGSSIGSMGIFGGNLVVGCTIVDVGYVYKYDGGWVSMGAPSSGMVFCVYGGATGLYAGSGEGD